METPGINLSQEQETAIRERVAVIPIMETLAIEILSMAEGTCTVRVPYKKAYDGIFESFHGGLLMTVADTVACFAVMTEIGTEDTLTTTDMNIRFLNGCRTDVTAIAKTIKTGRTLCPVEVNLYDAHDTHVAVAQVTYMRLSAKK